MDDDRAAPPLFLTTREVADLLRVKERKVYELVASGEIPHRRVTGKLLFPRAELDAWLAGAAFTPSIAAGVASPRSSAASPRSSAAGPAPMVLAGSHDPLLDWAIRESGAGIASFFDGSLDGLERLARGEAAAAGLHVFEPDRGDWNLDHAADRLGARPVALVAFARRRQGLLVSPEHAAAVRGVADLAGLKLARRQPTAGAGLLLAHLLREAGLARDAVRFDDDLARTETEAAAAVASGAVDAAPGIEAVARQFGLAFVPTVEERFDLAVDRRAWFEPPFQRLFDFCRSKAFADKAAALGGYDLAEHGRVRWNAP